MFAAFVSRLRGLVTRTISTQVQEANVRETVSQAVLADVQTAVTDGVQDALRELRTAIEAGVQDALHALHDDEPQAHQPKPKAKAKPRARGKSEVAANGRSKSADILASVERK